MWEIYKSGSVRGIEVFHRVEYCDTPPIERAEQQGIQSIPKWKTIICLLDIEVGC